MNLSLYDLLTFLGALALFIYGMKVMSEGIQKVAGKRLRKFLGGMTSGPLMGVFTGFSTTALIQSSSATTVMLVSFVNAGLLSFRQAIGVIMGANIGTTMTAVLIMVFGFSKFSIAAYSLPLLAISFPFLFSRNAHIRFWGESLFGFALLFLGLELMGSAFPTLNEQAFSTLKGLTDMGALSIILFVVIGAVITVLIQSSSAAIALTFLMCEQGWIPFDAAAAIVLGENIGTTFTANAAAVVGNIHAKRTAITHFIFNLFGVIWMLFLLRPFLEGIDLYMSSTSMGSPFTNTAAIKWGLTLFHILFNLINAFILIWFVRWIEKLVVFFTPSSKVNEKHYQLEYIGSGLMATPELSLLEARKEISKFGSITSKMPAFIKALIYERDPEAQTRLLNNVKKYEEITDRIEMEIADYLSRVSQDELSHDSTIKIRGMLNIVNDLESIGDVFFQLSKTIERKNREKLWFTQDQRESLTHLLALIEEAYAIMLQNLERKDDQPIDLRKAEEQEAKIDQYTDELRTRHLENIEHNEEYNIKSGLVYNDLFISCEKVGNHIINVSKALTGKV